MDRESRVSRAVFSMADEIYLFVFVECALFSKLLNWSTEQISFTVNSMWPNGDVTLKSHTLSLLRITV